MITDSYEEAETRANSSESFTPKRCVSTGIQFSTEICTKPTETIFERGKIFPSFLLCRFRDLANAFYRAA